MTTLDYIKTALAWYEEDPINRSISLDTKTYTLPTLCLPDSKLSIWLYDNTLSGGMHYVGGEIDLRDKVLADKAEMLARLQKELAA